MSEQENDMDYKFKAGDKESEKPLIKEEQEDELEKLFDVRNTAQFRVAPLKIKEAWLKHIVENKGRFTKYHNTWESWLADRRQEIGQQILFDKFGVRKTADLRSLLDEGKFNEFEECIKYIDENRDEYFPRYDDKWFADRQRELAEAQK